MSVDLVAIIFCIMLAALAVFQFALALGAPLGRFAWGGYHTTLPANLRIGSLVAIAIYALLALIILAFVQLHTVFDGPGRSSPSFGAALGI